MKRLVMFDMDGVLFDTMPRHAEAWKQTMAELGLEFPEEVFYLHEGRTGKSTIETLIGPEADHVRIYSRKCEIFDSLPKGTAMHGAKKVVEAVRSAGADAIVVTGSGQKKTVARIEKEYPGLFKTEWMVTGNDVTKGKPDPEPYQKGMEHAGVKPEEAVVVENAPLGVQSGHAAGCYVVAVNTGPLPDSVLIKAGADVVFPDMETLSENILLVLSK